jgi:hypothetical protein
MLHHVSITFLLLLHFTRCFAASSTITAEDGGSTCTKDEVYSSLSKEGREFCESVLEDHCATVSMPPAYTLLEDDEISSYVSCHPDPLSLTLSLRIRVFVVVIRSVTWAFFVFESLQYYHFIIYTDIFAPFLPLFFSEL